MLQAVILGILQGGTEFLPVSSSGHLAMYSALFKWTSPTLAFAVALHMGTLLAVIVYYLHDMRELIRGFFNTFTHREYLTDHDRFYLRLCWLLVLAVIPAGVVGLIFSERIGETMAQPHLVAVFFFVTAILLVTSSWYFSTERDPIARISPKHALWVGFFQILALFPGVSRSGSTIAAGVFAGMNREDAARFSFLLSIPTLAAAGVLEVKDALTESVSNVAPLAVLCGFATSFVVGFFSIKFFFAIIKRAKFYYFAAYCAVHGIVGLIFA
jgi:undecaprenyl-diphosphatase